MILPTRQPVHVGPSLVMAFSVLTFSRNWARNHNVCQHSGVSLVLSIEYLMALTHRACSWSIHKMLSVSYLISPFFSHSHLFPSSVLSVSLENWPWTVVSFHSIRRCFSLSCLFYTFVNFIGFSFVVAAMISFSLHLRAYSAKFLLSSLTQSSTLTNPLTPSLNVWSRM